MRELQLLDHIYQHNAGLPQRVTIRPGDDMGRLRLGGRDVLVTVDQVADGVHFLLEETPLEKIARKAITRNLSDVAAMAAQPVGAVVAGCLPGDFGEARANELFDAMRATAAGFDCPLVGGDISIWKGPLVLSVTIFAEPAGIEPVLRKGAQVGDVICVTGQLGGSAETVDDPPGYTHHLDFEPRLNVARQLAGEAARRPHCMIDLSDGLARDVRHLCVAGEVAAELWADRLPLSRGAHRASHRTGEPTWRHALGDGEDYELCFTVSPAAAERSLPREIDGVAITEVGVITRLEDKSGSLVSVKTPDGSIVDVDEMGWEHHT